MRFRATTFWRGIEQIVVMQAGAWKTVDVLGRYVENADTHAIHERRWAKLGHAR